MDLHSMTMLSTAIAAHCKGVCEFPTPTAGVLQQNNIPYQEFVDRGYFRCIESSYSMPDGTNHVSIKTVVFQKGLNFIRKVVSANLSASKN